MPHIVIFNLNKDDRSEENLNLIEEKIVEVIQGIKELELTRNDISFTFVEDTSVVTETIPVIVIIELLFDKPERTHEVRQKMAEGIGLAVYALLASWRKKMPEKIEVAVKKFDPEKDGFFTTS